VLAPDETFTVDPGALAHRLPGTPYAGRTLHGVVVATWLAGRPLDVRAGPPRGRLLLPAR
jgi:allantoinase